METTNVTISELTTLMTNEARSLGFSEATIWRNWMHRVGMVITYYREKGVCLYDPVVTEAFVQETRQRCESGDVSKNYLKQIRQITGRLNEFFLTGTLRMDITVHGTRYELNSYYEHLVDFLSHTGTMAKTREMMRCGPFANTSVTLKSVNTKRFQQ